MRLLRVIHSMDPATGGPVAGIRAVQPRLAERGCKVSVLCANSGRESLPETRSAEHELPIHALGSLGNGYGWSLRWSRWLRAHANAFDAAVIHGVWQYHGWAAACQLRRAGVPYALMPHGMLDPWFDRRHPLKAIKKRMYWKMVERGNLLGARMIGFTSEAERQKAVRHWRICFGNDQVVPYGVSDPFGGVAPLVGDPRNERMLLYLGRLHPKKGLEDLIIAFRRLPESPDGQPRLVIAGPCASKAYRESLVLLARDDCRIEVRDAVYGVEKNALLIQCDALVLPSYQENFGMVVPEALSCGRPVLLTRGVDIWQTVIGAGAGSVTQPGVEGVSGLLREWQGWSPDFHEVVCRCARRCFEEHYSATSAADFWISWIQSAMVSTNE